ncbi:hypothetical protein D3C78_751190 [compost metagenome]
MFEDTVGEVLELLAEAGLRLLLQLQLLGAGDALAAQGGFGILEAGGELEQQGLLLLQLLLAQHLLVLQLVEPVLQRLMALLGEQCLLPGRATPRQPAEEQGQQTRQQGRQPGRHRDHRRLR